MAEKRKAALRARRRKRRITLLCIFGGLGAALLSLVICLLIYGPIQEEEETAGPVQASVTYDPSKPFSLSDLTPQQLSQVRQGKRISVSDGPRGISIGDSLETILERYPSSTVEMLPSQEQTGEQSDELQILYCADYFRNENGKMTILPPRGLLSVDSGRIVVTLLSPMVPYPAGTREEYGMYEHIYCVYTIDPESMTVSSIVLGTDA